MLKTYTFTDESASREVKSPGTEAGGCSGVDVDFIDQR